MINYYSILFMLLTCVEIKSQENKDVVLVLQKLDYGSMYNASCFLTGDAMKSAASWINRIPSKDTYSKFVSEFIPNRNSPYNCNIDNTRANCNYDWTEPIGGKIENSLNSLLGPVLDRRWEDFQTFHTNGVLSFTEIAKISNSRKFQVYISIRTMEGHIYLCDSDDPPSSDCYWIILNGWGGKASAIRKCESSIPRKDGDWPRGPCSILRDNHTSEEMLDTAKWSHFLIRRNDNNIQLYKLGDSNPILNYTDQDDIYKIKNILVTSRNKIPGYWKVHNYDYVITNKILSYKNLGVDHYVYGNTFCASIFVTMCTNCQLNVIVTVYDPYVGNFETFKEVNITSKNKAWQEEKIVVDLRRNSQVDLRNSQSAIRLRVSTICDNCKSPFWALDYFELCNENEVRVLKGSLDFNDASCEVLRTSLQVKLSNVDKNYPPDNNCGIGMFGSTCLKCSNIFGTQRYNCDKSIMCGIDLTGQNVCKCSMGYIGDACQEACFPDFYGYGCREKCGYCQYPPCHPVTGACDTNACLYGYKEYDCKLPPSPVLLYPPEVFNVEYTSFMVQLQNLSYEGTQTPVFYKIQFKEQNAPLWQTTDNIDIANLSPKKIINLQPLTTYVVRAILVAENITHFDRDIIPQINVSTTCKLIVNEDVDIRTANTTVWIAFKNDKESCPSTSYQIEVNHQTLNSNTYSFEVTNLTPFTTYSARILNRFSKEEIKVEFTTDEGAPSKVKDLEAIPINEGSIKVSWSAPLQAHGVIKYFEVTYQHLHYLGCSRNNKMPNVDSQKTLRELNYSIVIENLIPFSQYRIDVAAYTVTLGEQATTLVETAGTDTPSQTEIPSINHITPENTKINIFFDEPNCTTIKGLLDYYVKLQCHNEWCSRSPTTSNFSSINYSKPLVLPNAFPFSNYTVSINVGRKNGKMNTSPDVVASTVTLTSVPNIIQNIEVYSKNEVSISLRFPLPYPPTGLLAEYFVVYCYPTYFSWVCDQEYIRPSWCKLWPDYQCLTITNLRENTDYRLEVRAKNNGTDFNQPARITAVTTQSIPHPPQNLSANWDEYYNLTLQWVHPNITNGPLTKFVVRIVTNKSICCHIEFPITEETYQLLYQHIVQINSSCYSSNLDIYVHSHNAVRYSVVSLTISSPPTSPFLVPQPTIASLTNTTILLNLQGVFNLEHTVKTYIFVISETDDSSTGTVYDEDMWNKLKLPEQASAWLVAELDYNFYHSSQQVFTVGDNAKYPSVLTQTETYNKPLLPSTNYFITVFLINDFNGLKRHARYTLNATTTGHKTEKVVDSGSNGLFALLLLILIPVILWIGISHYRKKKAINWNTLVTMVNTGGRSSANPDVIPLTTDKVSEITTLSPVNSIKKVETVITTKENAVNQTNKYSRPIKIIEFEKYVKESIENGELARQHELFPRGQTKPWDYGILPQNKSKNRYNNLIAYDHSRVKLEKIDNDEFSDYVNANFIEGYKTSRGYIATQGPKPATVNDFWRMIWQEKVNYIVMLANVIEGGKKKSEQYWPNVGESVVYGNINVEYLNSQIFADYEYRTFLVQYDNEERTVEQLHFVSWPDHGVPLYSQSLVPFLRKLLTIPQGKSPVVVHCSAGVGRTGTIILCDLCLRMAAREGIVDILKHQHNLRQQRANLVDNVEQYKLAHLVLLECLIAPQTTLSCDDSIGKAVTTIIESNSLQHHMEYLRNNEWQDHAMQTTMSLTVQPQWASKNRFQEIIPGGYGRVYISRYPVTDEHSDYINAVEVDGFRAPQRFIATQLPLPNTVCDFWRMVDEKEVSIIICLNQIQKDDTTCCKFWPTKDRVEIKPVPYLTLRLHNQTKNETFTRLTIQLHNTKGKKGQKRIIHLISLKGLPHTTIVPDNKDAILTLWEETERLSKGTNNPIVVTCHNGSTACGLFLALTFLIEKINLEQQCDVCLAVRTVRRNRKEFVTEKEQFIFLYQMALLYLSKFSLYANFSLPSTSSNS